MAELAPVALPVDDPESLQIGVGAARVASRAIDLGRVGAKDAQEAMEDFLASLGARFGVMRADWTVEIANPLLRDDLDAALTSNFQDLLAETNRGGFANRALTALAEGRPFVGDAEVSIGGATLVWECRVRAGAGDRLYIAARDVTAERRHDADLAREREAIALIESHAQVGRWSMSTDDGGLTFSMTALKLLGYSDEEALIGSADAREDLVHLEALALRALAEKRPAVNRMVVSRGAGHARSVKAIATPAHRAPSEPARALGLLIEEGWSGKAAGASSEDKRRTDIALTLAKAAVYELDNRTGRNYMSGSWRDIFTDRSEFRIEAGNNDWVWSVFHPEDRSAAIALWKEHLKTGAPFVIRHRVARLDNKEQWLINFAKAFHENGELVRVVGFLQDVTPPPALEPPPAPAQRLRRRALVVEPSARNRDALRQMLDRCDLDCETASDGRAGLHIVTETNIDLIIVDAAAGPDALDLVRAVRAGLAAPATNAATPILLTVPSIAQTLAADYVAAGASDQLNKPFRPSDLAAAIERATAVEWL